MDSKARELIIWIATNIDERKIDGNDLINVIGHIWSLVELDVQLLIKKVLEGNVTEQEALTEKPPEDPPEEIPDIPSAS